MGQGEKYNYHRFGSQVGVGRKTAPLLSSLAISDQFLNSSELPLPTPLTLLGQRLETRHVKLSTQRLSLSMCSITGITLKIKIKQDGLRWGGKEVSSGLKESSMISRKP